MKTLLFTLMTLSVLCFADPHIHERGYWVGTDIMHEHKFDRQLANALVDFFKQEKAASVVDFGCGPGEYLKVFNQNQIQSVGYDGNPSSLEISSGLVRVLDLSKPFDLKKRFDWVLCLEVGEHILKKYEEILIKNLNSHANKGIILSWAVPGQGGYGHFLVKGISSTV